MAVFEEGITRTVMCIIVRFIVCTTPNLALKILIVKNSPVMDTYEVNKKIPANILHTTAIKSDNNNLG